MGSASLLQRYDNLDLAAIRIETGGADAIIESAGVDGYAVRASVAEAKIDARPQFVGADKRAGCTRRRPRVFEIPYALQLQVRRKHCSVVKRDIEAELRPEDHPPQRQGLARNGDGKRVDEGLLFLVEIDDFGGRADAQIALVEITGDLRASKPAIGVEIIGKKAKRVDFVVGLPPVSILPPYESKLEAPMPS